MGWNPTELIRILLGGGGALIIRALWDVLKERRKGQMAHEDTTIGRYKFFADQEEERRKEAEAETLRVKRELRWYRNSYSEMWRAYRLSGAGREAEEFPFGPPEDLN